MHDPLVFCQYLLYIQTNKNVNSWRRFLKHVHQKKGLRTSNFGPSLPERQLIVARYTEIKGDKPPKTILNQFISLSHYPKFSNERANPATHVANPSLIRIIYLALNF